VNTLPGSLVRRGRWLAWATIGWNTIEGVVAIGSGAIAGSIALVGFGVDSFVEVFAGAVILWRLAKEQDGQHVSDAAEQRAVKLIAATFLMLAVGIAFESVRKLASGTHPDASTVGIALTAVSLVLMPLLARAKRTVGVEMGSRAVEADATETMLCVWLSAIVLSGLLLNMLFSWWWADPLAGLGIVYIAAREGIIHWQEPVLDDCC
jgi:divalent metal cation (Fe/Co/Zn/Cd) transporter